MQKAKLKSCNLRLLGIIFFTLSLILFACQSYADLIQPSEVVAIPTGVLGSGNGTLDLTLFIDAGGGGVINNANGTFNGDDANSDLPTGANGSYAESYVTTVGKIRSFYDLNFGIDVIDEIVIFLDLNETTSGGPVNHLEVMDVYINPLDDFTIQGSPDPTTSDVSSAQQNAINQVFTSATPPEAWLDQNNVPYNLPLNNQGAGFADYAIFTGINPYSAFFNDDDVILFNQSISFLTNGGETKFLSGEYSGQDIKNPVPVPAPMLLLGSGLLGLVGARFRRRK